MLDARRQLVVPSETDRGPALHVIVGESESRDLQHSQRATEQQGLQSHCGSEDHRGSGLLQQWIEIDRFEQVNTIVSDSGFILSDIKFEFGKDPKTGEIILGDSIGPDEFRIWNKGDYQVGQIQDSYDKQLLRDWLEEIGFRQEVEKCNNSRLEPNIPKLPKEIIEKISQRYVDAYERITGATFSRLD